MTLFLLLSVQQVQQSLLHHLPAHITNHHLIHCQIRSQTAVLRTALKRSIFASAAIIKSTTWVAAQGTDHRGITGSENHIGIENGDLDWENHTFWSSFQFKKMALQIPMLAMNKLSQRHPSQMPQECNFL